MNRGLQSDVVDARHRAPEELDRDELLRALRLAREENARLRRQAELSRAERRRVALLEAFFAHAPIQLGIKDRGGRYQIVSGAFLADHGLTRTIEGQSADAFMPPAVAEHVAAHDRKVLRSGETAYRDIRATINGADRNFLAVKFPILDALTGKITHLGAIVTDVSALKRTERELRRRRDELESHVAERSAALARANYALAESEEQFRRIIDQSPAVIMLKSLDGRYRIVNRAMAGWVGRPAAEIVGKTARDIFPEDQAERAEADDARVLADGHLVSRETWSLRRDGSRRRMHITKFPVLSRDGNIAGIAALSEDITERHLAEEQLRHAQKMHALGQLTGGIAHDFNNLLAVVLGNVDALLEQEGTAERSLQAIRRAATRGAELTQRLLAFSRQQPLAPKAFDPAELLLGMDGLLSRTLGKGIVIAVTCARDVWPTLADPAQVENALLNLAINARDAMPEGGRLTISASNYSLPEGERRATESLPAGDYVEFAVRDTGHGMSAEVLERAVDPFFTTKPPGKGSGLGLSMVYGFARQSGGQVAIESVPGGGTTVRLYLPRATILPAETDSPVAAAPGGGESVLVVEDNPDVLDLTTGLLKRLGYRVRVAADGRQALAALEAEPAVDLVLCDIGLPGAPGAERLAQTLRERWPELRLVFMSGYANAEPEILRWADAPLLNKPFERHDLAAALRHALDRPARRS